MSIEIRYYRLEVSIVDMNLLRYFMRKNGDKQSDLARAIKLPQSALSARMNGKVSFRQTEMNAIRKRYSLSADNVMAIFFVS